MIDEAHIQMTLNRFTESSSRRDWAAMLATFLPDGIWEVPALNVNCQGHDQIREMMEAFGAPMDYIVQINAPAVIDVSGDKATARSVIRESGKYTDRDEVLEVHGFYNDELVRTSAGWKFSRRTFVVAGMNNFARLPAS